MVPSVVRCGLPRWPAAQQRRDWLMTEDAYSSSADRRAERETSGWAVGFIMFAAIIDDHGRRVPGLAGARRRLRERVLRTHPQLHLPVRRHQLGAGPTC